MLLTLLLSAVLYASPVHFEVLLAGNFGEPRPNHFHGGLDIKTQQEEGKAIYSIGDGYVSRVTVNLDGMGNAIYVRHPEGYTSVYAHLQRFAPMIEAKLRKWQYEHHSTDADVSFAATDCPGAKGQVIALSGDTGASMGPHLHLEIHRTDNWNMLDPLEFIPELVQDTVKPVAHSFMAYPQGSEGMFCGKTTPQRFEFTNHEMEDEFTAWGKVGFGIYADDYMQGSANTCGIRHTCLLVDGVEVFSSDVNNISMADNKLVNIWGDVDYFMKHQQWFLKSYLEPGNTLSFLKADKNRGIVHFDQERTYRIRYLLQDFFGNVAEYAFIVRGVQNDMPAEQMADSVEMETPPQEEDLGKDLTLRIIPLNQRQWNEEHVLLFDIKGPLTGAISFEGFVDDQFILFDHVKKSSRIICDLRQTPVVATGLERHLLVKVHDATGQEAQFEAPIVY